MAGIDIPEIKPVDLDKLDILPPINLPDEKQAFAIKRFDRNNNARIHMEEEHKKKLKNHWSNLQQDFRIETE